MKADKFVIIGYIPMMTTKTIGEGGASTPIYYDDKDGVKEHLQSAQEIFDLAQKQHLGQALGILWAARDGKGVPIFILNRARDIYDDLFAYSEGHIEKFFTLNIAHNSNGMVAALIPNFEKVIERFNYRMKLEDIEMTEEPTYNMLFLPISFVAPIATNYKGLVDAGMHPQGTVNVCFIDTKDMSADFASITDDKFIELGELPVGGKFGDDYVASELKDADFGSPPVFGSDGLPTHFKAEEPEVKDAGMTMIPSDAARQVIVPIFDALPEQHKVGIGTLVNDVMAVMDSPSGPVEAAHKIRTWIKYRGVSLRASQRDAMMVQIDSAILITVTNIVTSIKHGMPIEEATGALKSYLRNLFTMILLSLLRHGGNDLSFIPKELFEKVNKLLDLYDPGE